MTMHRLRMLGGITLSTADGREVDAVLRQPKAVALLAYLALPLPGTWHRRIAPPPMRTSSLAP